MEIVGLDDAPGYDSDQLVAQPLIEGAVSNVRMIRLSPGQALPPHRHGSSDLMLFAVEGTGALETAYGPELRVSNDGQAGLTLLAFLAPPFPPRSAT